MVIHRISILIGALLAGLPALGGCVFRTEHKVETVHKIDAHIVLDIRQIREDAAQVEDYVRGRSEEAPQLNENGQPISLVNQGPGLYRLAAYQPGPVVRFQAVAQATSDEEARAIDARKERARTIERLLAEGVVGENEKGYLEVLISADAREEEQRRRRAELSELARAENRDRRTIYLAVAKRQNLDEKSLPAIERIFAEQIRDRLQPGQKFQAPKDRKFFEDFQKTELGRLYPNARPGDWLVKQRTARRDQPRT